MLRNRPRQVAARAARREIARTESQRVLHGIVTAIDAAETPATTVAVGPSSHQAYSNAGVEYTVGDKVSLDFNGRTWTITGRLDLTHTGAAAGMVPVGGIVLWPAANPIPAGWEEVTVLAGRFVVHPNGTTFVAGTTGGTSTHGHTTGSANDSTNRSPDGAAGTASVAHGHTVNSANHLPPWSAVYIWIRRIA